MPEAEQQKKKIEYLNSQLVGFYEKPIENGSDLPKAKKAEYENDKDQMLNLECMKEAAPVSRVPPTVPPKPKKRSTWKIAIFRLPTTNSLALELFILLSPH